RLVSENRPGDSADSGHPHLAREAPEVGAAEGRVAVSLQDESPSPGRPYQLALAEGVGLDPGVRAKDLERRVGDRQLLVRRGGEREAGVPLEDGGSRRQVEGDRAGPGGGDVRHGQGPGKTYGEGLRRSAEHTS